MNDVRSAQALGFLATVPLAVPSTLMAFKVIPATLMVALGLAAVLLVIDGIGWLIVSATFDRERLIVASR
jgi:hypothetical protein